MNYKVEILKAFLENNTLITSMKNCDHSNGNKYNPYHMEGSVWTHTMLVYNQVTNNDPFLLIMALCHDIGKVLSRKINDNDKVTFYGHADMSVQPTIDFIKFLVEKEIITSFQAEYFIKICLPMMANHMIYYQNIEKFDSFTHSNDKKTSYLFKYYLKMMAKIDTEGSISKSEKVDKKNYNIKLEHFNKKEKNDNLKNIIIWSGVPASGKDYLAEKNGYPIISFDDIRVEIFKNNNKINDLSESEIYKKAYNFINENNINLMKPLIKKIKNLSSDFNTINICNTSLTRKSRKSIINSLNQNKYNFYIKQIFSPTETSLMRNAIRESKTIPLSAMNKMFYRVNVATHFEKGICDIEYIYNV
jgi:hypothetical protein